MSEEIFSFFSNGIKNTIPNDEINISKFLKIIKEENPLIEQIRNESDKDKRDLLKSKLSYITFGGTFEKRANDKLKQGSGLVCLDYDGLQNIEETKQKLMKNEYTYCVFVSPSGKGLKLLVKIPEVKNNEEYKSRWSSIAHHYNITETDESTKDISRACYLSYDTNPYFNPNSKIYEKVRLNLEETTDRLITGEVEDYEKLIQEVVKSWKEGERQELALSTAGYLRKNKRLGINKVKTIISKVCEITNDKEIDMRLRAVDETFKKDEREVKGFIGLKDKVNLDEEEKKEDYKLFSRRGQIETFYKEQPFFYDKSKIFWLWDKENKKWILSDEVDYLNCIRKELGAETIDSKTRIELIEGFKQVGREKKPEDIKKSWVQFKNKVYDIQTGESFEATPKYFITNPLPWNVGESEETPTIDKLLNEWVGKEYSQTLYEIIAYCISSDKFMQRLFAFVGGGSNGKGTFIKLLYKFLGKNNYISSDLKPLSENRFELAGLYKKLLCVIGEVSYDDLKNTNQIKKLAGEDLISFEIKGKMSFSDENSATCICLTNSLPTTPDKSTGFYRKWLIIDFPNQFKDINKNLIEKIPEKEFENLAKKSLRILKGLYESRKFTNEGDFEERAKRYEERSNPVMRFIEEYCEESEGENISLRNFTNYCNEYLKINHLRTLTSKQISKNLREEGFIVGNRKLDDISSVVILNLHIKLSKLSKLSNSQIDYYIETSKKMDSNHSYNSFLDDNKENNNKDLEENLLKLTPEQLEEAGFNSIDELREVLK